METNPRERPCPFSDGVGKLAQLASTGVRGSVLGIAVSDLAITDLSTYLCFDPGRWFEREYQIQRCFDELVAMWSTEQNKVVSAVHSKVREPRKFDEVVRDVQGRQSL